MDAAIVLIENLHKRIESAPDEAERVRVSLCLQDPPTEGQQAQVMNAGLGLGLARWPTARAIPASGVGRDVRTQLGPRAHETERTPHE